MKKINHKPLLPEAGFTMVELLLYMGIFSILLVVLIQLFTSILSLHLEPQATSSVDQDGAAILSRLSYDIHKSASISSPTIGSQCNWPTTSTCKLVVSNATYQLDGNGNLLLTAN